MRYFKIFIAIILFMPISQAYAGFEWLPPSKNPAPTMAPQQHDTAVHPSTPIQESYGTMTSAPPPPVAAAPLNSHSPMSILPQGQSSRRADGGLYIDPYPLRQFDPAETYAQDTTPPVEQAMVEETESLHPLPLGAGMKTGAQAPDPPIISAYKEQPATMPFKSMTPMMGGEPASMPGHNATGILRGPAYPPGHYPEAVGFGKDLPLALALSQVIPPQFTHSYASGVEPGVTVSWQGGKPWNQVLDEMLKPKGLMAIVSGNRVSIQLRARS